MNTPLADQPAFPTGPLNRVDTMPGLTIRQKFAFGFARDIVVATTSDRALLDKDVVAENAVRYADALIAALRKK